MKGSERACAEGRDVGWIFMILEGPGVIAMKLESVSRARARVSGTLTHFTRHDSLHSTMRAQIAKYAVGASLLRG